MKFFGEKRIKAEAVGIVKDPAPVRVREYPKKTPEENLLESREKTKEKPLIGGANKVVFIELKDDGSGIFKPADGEQKHLREGIPGGSYYLRERAAYLINRFLNFDLVPPTVIREIDGKVGSLQEFVADAKEGREMPQIWLEDKYRDDLKKMLIFDYIIWNVDRHDRNFLVKDAGILAIDNGLSFGNSDFEPFMRFYAEEIPDSIADNLKKFFGWEEGKAILKDLLLELLESGEVEACFSRMKHALKLLEGGRIPSNLNDFKFNPA